MGTNREKNQDSGRLNVAWGWVLLDFWIVLFLLGLTIGFHRDALPFKFEGDRPFHFVLFTGLYGALGLSFFRFLKDFLLLCPLGQLRLKAHLRRAMLRRKDKILSSAWPSAQADAFDPVSLLKAHQLIDSLYVSGESPYAITQVQADLRDKVVLITGGGGSIGSELARQLAKLGVKQLVLLDIYENKIYALQQELLHRYGEQLDLHVLIGSVRDEERLEEIFETYQPQWVFHAAAHKHVPLMEFAPKDAVKNNIYGSYHVANLAGRFDCERFVLVSTDKAVHPTNVYGATKRIAEMLTLSLQEKWPNTRFICVRFGNILASNGSVIPLFQSQIHQERRVTLTDPKMKRFFMTIPEATCLLLEASKMAEDGQLFILDMGEAVYIKDLACALIEREGLRPEKDVKIEYIGLRPGEKLEEELVFANEKVEPTAYARISMVRQVNSGLFWDEYEKELKAVLRQKDNDLDQWLATHFIRAEASIHKIDEDQLQK